MSGRLYNIYGSSNLVDGFSLIESKVPGGIFFYNHHTGDTAGFYKITVELNE